MRKPTASTVVADVAHVKAVANTRPSLLAEFENPADISKVAGAGIADQQARLDAGRPLAAGDGSRCLVGGAVAACACGLAVGATPLHDAGRYVVQRARSKGQQQHGRAVWIARAIWIATRAAEVRPGGGKPWSPGAACSTMAMALLKGSSLLFRAWRNRGTLHSKPRLGVEVAAPTQGPPIKGTATEKTLNRATTLKSYPPQPA